MRKSFFQRAHSKWSAPSGLIIGGNTSVVFERSKADGSEVSWDIGCRTRMILSCNNRSDAKVEYVKGSGET